MTAFSPTKYNDDCILIKILESILFEQSIPSYSQHKSNREVSVFFGNGIRQTTLLEGELLDVIAQIKMHHLSLLSMYSVVPT